MSHGSRRTSAVILGLGLAFSLHVGLLAVLAGNVPAPALALGGALGAAAASLLAHRDSWPAMRAMPRADLAWACLAGAAGGWASVYLVASHRYSDAPSGSEVVFFTAPVWGAVACVLAAWSLIRSGRRWAAAGVGAGALAAVVGCAGVVANWERPSTFSPLVKFPVDEMWMVLGGVAFVAYAWRASRSARDPSSDPGGGGLAGGLAAVAAALVCWAVSGDPAAGLTAVGRNAPAVALWAVSFGVVFALVPSVFERAGAGAAGAAMCMAPVLLSGLTVVEQQVGVAGPQPLLLDAVSASSVLVAAGVVRVIVSEWGEEPAPWSRWRRVAGGIAAAGVLLAVVGLAVPAMRASAEGGEIPTEKRSVSWTLPAAETVPGWVAVSVALLALVAARDRRMLPAALAACAAPAYVLLGTTPLHVVTRWLPSEMQQDFGTEYASITFEALANRVQQAGIAGAGGGLAVVLIGGLLRGGGLAPPERPGESEDVG